jgi:triphosphatase
MSEIELKFGVLPARAGAIDAALRRAGARRLMLESRYFDTPDRRLAEAGLSLRLRRSSGLWEQTLKAPAEGLGERLEENVLRPGRWGSEGPPLDPSLHDGTAAGKRLREVVEKGEPASDGIVTAHGCRIERRSIEIEAFGGRVEVAFDRGDVHAGTALAPVCELEYELKGGEPRALIEFGKEAVREHGAWLSTLTKALRGDRLARGQTEGEPVKARPPVLDRRMDGAQVFRAALRACLDQVAANASEIGAGSRAADAVHQLRVGIRRTRTAWRELAPLCPVPGADWEAPLIEAFRALGTFRDRHTVVASLQARLAASGAPEPTLAASDEAEPADPVEVVRAAAFQHALLDALALTLPVTGEPAARSASETLEFVASRLDRLHKQLKRAARRFEASTPADQHQARKRLKRLRYLGELTGSLFKAKPVERYLGRLAPAQDALGAHIDLLVGLERARATAEAGEAEAWFNVGWLTAQLDASAVRCARALERAAKSDPFWRG